MSEVRTANRSVIINHHRQHQHQPCRAAAQSVFKHWRFVSPRERHQAGRRKRFPPRARSSSTSTNSNADTCTGSSPNGAVLHCTLLHHLPATAVVVWQQLPLPSGCRARVRHQATCAGVVVTFAPPAPVRLLRRQHSPVVQTHLERKGMEKLCLQARPRNGPRAAATPTTTHNSPRSQQPRKRRRRRSSSRGCGT